MVASCPAGTGAAQVAGEAEASEVEVFVDVAAVAVPTADVTEATDVVGVGECSNHTNKGHLLNFGNEKIGGATFVKPPMIEATFVWTESLLLEHALFPVVWEIPNRQFLREHVILLPKINK